MKGKHQIRRVWEGPPRSLGPIVHISEKGNQHALGTIFLDLMGEDCCIAVAPTATAAISRNAEREWHGIFQSVDSQSKWLDCRDFVCVASTVNQIDPRYNL